MPYGLLEERPSTSSLKRDGRSSDGPAVYFTRRGILVRIGLQPQPASAGPQARLARALDSLATGPTAREQEMGIGTAIPAGLRITAVSSPRAAAQKATISQRSRWTAAAYRVAVPLAEAGPLRPCVPQPEERLQRSQPPPAALQAGWSGGPGGCR